jgi:hypothetical protein
VVDTRNATREVVSGREKIVRGVETDPLRRAQRIQRVAAGGDFGQIAEAVAVGVGVVRIRRGAGRR